MVLPKFLNWLERSPGSSPEEAARSYLLTHGILQVLDAFPLGYGACGLSLVQYALLHDQIRRRRPRYVLECGTGRSTYVIARAMADFCADRHPDIKLVSMEENFDWFEQAQACAKGELARYGDFVEIVLSPIGTVRHGFISGTVYTERPDYPFEFVFADGPDPQGGCNLDLLEIVLASDRPVIGMTEGRLFNAMAYALLFGTPNIRYLRHGSVCIAGPVTRNDVFNKDRLKVTRDQILPSDWSLPFTLP